jgi:DNA-binding MarR family transcriptional regulator
MDDSEMVTDAIHSWMQAVMQFSMRGFMQFSKENGISIPQLGALMQISKSRCHGVSGLGEGLGVTSAAASQMLERLVQQGYVVRSEDPEDRRSKTIKLTPKGEKTIKEGMDARQSWIPMLAERMDTDERKNVTSALILLTDKLKEIESVQSQTTTSEGGIV